MPHFTHLLSQWSKFEWFWLWLLNNLVYEKIYGKMHTLTSFSMHVLVCVYDSFFIYSSGVASFKDSSVFISSTTDAAKDGIWGLPLQSLCPPSPCWEADSMSTSMGLQFQLGSIQQGTLAEYLRENEMWVCIRLVLSWQDFIAYRGPSTERQCSSVGIATRFASFRLQELLASSSHPFGSWGGNSSSSHTFINSLSVNQASLYYPASVSRGKPKTITAL